MTIKQCVQAMVITLVAPPDHKHEFFETSASIEQANMAIFSRQAAGGLELEGDAYVPWPVASLTVQP
jgi:hypothetical protein